MRECFLAVLLALSAATLPAAFELRPGVIVDRALGAAYIGGSGGGVHAIDLASGRLLWSSADAALPLALHGSLLAAQAEDPGQPSNLRVVVLDVRAKGRKVAESTTRLPEGVRARVRDDLERSFRATAKYERGRFVVSWTYREMVVQGIAREPGVPLPERKLAGTAFVRVRSRGAVAKSRDGCKALPRSPTAAAHETRRSAVWRAGSVFAQTIGGGGGPLTLHRWNACSGKPLPDRVLSEKALTDLVSADRQHLVVVERVARPPDPEYRWLVVSVESGEPIAEMPQSRSAAPFFVAGGLIVFVSQPHGFRSGADWVDVPLEILALRLATGDVVWRRAVRDLEYRGPMPPA